MIVADTSALVSIASTDLLDTFLTEFDVHTTETVVEELEATAGYDDPHADAAGSVLDNLDRIRIHHVQDEFESSRTDAGEGSCALLTGDIEAEFLLTDDLRALPELQTVAESSVAISPIVLRALVKRDVLEREQALDKLDELADQRNWLGAPIFRRARALLESR